MIATVHLLAGAVIGLLVPDKETIVVLALLSHYLLDLLPHIDPGTFTSKKLPFTWTQLIILITDGVAVAAIALLFYFTHKNWTPLLLGGIVALLPDVLMPVEHYWLMDPLRRFHDMFHWEPKLARQWSWYIIGLITPAVIAAASALIIWLRYS